MSERDYTALGEWQLLAVLGDDARKWAEAFCQCSAAWTTPPDIDLMTTWFANAIEHSNEVRTRRGRKNITWEDICRADSGEYPTCNGPCMKCSRIARKLTE